MLVKKIDLLSTAIEGNMLTISGCVIAETYLF
jgi:hypothetical protein